MRIIEAMLNGESDRSISRRLHPRISSTALWRYRRNHLQPALRPAEETQNALRCHGPVVPAENSPVANATTLPEANLDRVNDSFIGRINQKYERFDQVIPQIIASNDFAAFASVDKAETAALRLHAELCGRLGPTTNFGQVQIVIGDMKSDAAGQDEEEQIIELGVRR
jgi:hypothetical protein